MIRSKDYWQGEDDEWDYLMNYGSTLIITNNRDVVSIPKEDLPFHLPDNKPVGFTKLFPTGYNHPYPKTFCERWGKTYCLRCNSRCLMMDRRAG